MHNIKIIISALFLFSTNQVLAFSDITEENINQEAIELLAEQEIINGYSDGTFKPDNTLSRAELLKILI